MKKVLMINAHWNNHGDEAAIRAAIDELRKKGIQVSLQIISGRVFNYPYLKNDVPLLQEYPRRRNIPEYIVGIITKGKLVFSANGKEYFKNLKSYDLVIHAPGGPSIGDIYKHGEILYLIKFLCCIRLGIPYGFYAPSAGPFNSFFRNRIRKKIYQKAKFIIFREALSMEYFKNLLPNTSSMVTLDAAFQHDIDYQKEMNLLSKDKKLLEFISDGSNVIGMTITDLLWHPKYSTYSGLAEKISASIKTVVTTLRSKGYKILFIPQLFGESNDSELMKRFEIDENCYTMSENYDCYFQQYIIGIIHAVIGMRYHSNIFAAKMGTPFLSISYEQKMKGFIESISYEEYCILIENLNANLILDKFLNLEMNYETVKRKLSQLHENLKRESFITTEIVLNVLNEERGTIND